MLTAMADTGGGNFEKRYVITDINEETLLKAADIFENYHDRGVLLNESFADNEWILTNQLQRSALKWDRDELRFKSFAAEWLGCSYRCFVDTVKAFTIFRMGTLALPGVAALARSLMSLAEKPCDELPTGMHMLEFLKLLPGGSEVKDRVIEAMEDSMLFERWKQTPKRQRVLEDFSVYFRFNDALEDFWIRADEQEKLFYFPVYLWWNLTAILPLRPTEFLLTPRECLESVGGENILTLRRTKLKKGDAKKVLYTIAGDYAISKYSVPESMAAAIKWYKDATNEMEASEIDTLFVRHSHYAYLNREKPSHSRYYTYQNLSYSLGRFQDSMMKDTEDCVGRISLGDTRHLAMISLIVSGGSPSICRELAGHEDISVSAHYYANISRFVECATYELHRKQKNVRVEMLKSRMSYTGESVEVNGGRCDSAAYIAGAVSDCIKTMGPGGELGYCAACAHFIDGKSGRYLLFTNLDDRKKQIDNDCKYLVCTLEMVRRGTGCQEDIQTALLKLQHSSALYSRCLYENMEGL